MSTVVNITNVSKDIYDNSLQTENHEEVHMIAIIINLNDWGENMIDGGKIYLQRNPPIRCNFTFQIFGGLLHRYISFTSRASLNKQYLVTMFHFNNKNEIQLSETIKVVNNSLQKTHYFTKNYNMIYDKSKHLIKKRLCMFCKIEEIKVTPIAIEIIENEMPAKFLSLYEEKKLTDFKIICEDQEFCVHKIILVCQSDVFQAMFENPMKESREDTLTIRDFEPKIVEAMIRYLYSDEMSKKLSDAELKQLLLIADKYNLDKLMKICFNELLKIIKTFEQAADFIIFTGSHNFIDMKKLVIQFMKENKNILL